MKKGSKRRVSIIIDMTPMVDIAFLLLIFYMATTQFKPPEQRKVALPVSSSQRELPLKNFITITVTSADSVFLDYIIYVKKFDPQLGDSIEVPSREYISASPNIVGDEIKRMQGLALRQGIRNLYLVIKADQDASYGTIESIMDSMQENDLLSFQVVTELDPSISRSGGG